MTLPRITLLPGREKSLLRKHPWIYSGAIKNVSGKPDLGDTVEVLSADGRVLGKAAWSPSSQLRGRMWSFDAAEEIDENFFRRKIYDAANFRKMLGLDDPSGGCRLIFSESDGLPGLTVDRYANCAVAQFSSAGAEKHRETIGKILLELPGIESVFDRSDAAIRKKEGLPPRSGLLCGREIPEQLVICENGLDYSVDMRHGQKTGFYFDLRDARKFLGQFAEGRRILNTFSYTGAFCCTALANGGANVLNIDSSVPALKQSEINFKLNGFENNWENRAGDVFTELRKLESAGEKFDLVILDPPKLIDSQKSLMRGCRGYQDLARLGFKLLNPGGMLFNFSCSGLMDADLFQKISAAAAVEAGVSARMIGKLQQAADHPVLLSVPETFYLKGVVSVKI